MPCDENHTIGSAPCSTGYVKLGGGIIAKKNKQSYCRWCKQIGVSFWLYNATKSKKQSSYRDGGSKDNIFVQYLEGKNTHLKNLLSFYVVIKEDMKQNKLQKN